MPKQTIEIVQCLIPISHVNKMINVLIFIALKISDSERYTMDFWLVCGRKLTSFFKIFAALISLSYLYMIT